MSTAPDHAKLDGRSVLVVEDEFYQAVELTEEIERVGGTVIGPFPSADDGLAALTSSSPDCALLDINTGDGRSFAMADALIARAVPFVFLTGYDPASVPDRFSAIGHILKPATYRSVINALAKL